MREKIYNTLANLIIRHNGKVLVAVAAVTLLQLFLVTGLGIKNRLADMMPENVPQVESFNNIIADFTSDAQIMISVKSAEKNEELMTDAARHIADDLAVIRHITPIEEQELSLMQKWRIFKGEKAVEGVKYDTLNFVKRIDAKLDTEFFQNHGAIIQKNKDLKNFTGMYSDLSLLGLLRNINDNFEKEFVNDSGNLRSLDGEARAVSGLGNIYSLAENFAQFAQDPDSAKAVSGIKKFIIGDEYIFSPDRTMLLIGLLPAISTDDFDNLLIMSAIVGERIDGIREKYPDLEIGLAGTPVIGHEEMKAIKDDFGWSTLIALLIVFVIIIGSFKSWKNPFNSIITLIVSIIWTAGLLAVTIRYLNTMSAAFGVMLVGLGIDFAIHFLSGYRDALDHGQEPEKAVRTMYLTVGSGVMTGALTTAMVFFTLMFIGFKAFGEMGFAMGAGIIAAMAAMFVLLPALIVRDSRKNPSALRGRDRFEKIFSFKPLFILSEFMQFHFMENIGRLAEKKFYITSVIILSAILTALSVYGASKLEYEYDLTKLEPHGMPAIVAQDEILEKFEVSPDFAMFSVKGIETARAKVAEIKKLADRTGIIGRIDCITEYFESEDEQKINIDDLKEYRTRLLNSNYDGTVTADDAEMIADELQRLHYNMVEIGELSVMSSGEKNKIITKTDEIAGRSDEESKILRIRDIFISLEDPAGTVGKFQKAYIPSLRRFLFNITDTALVNFENFPDNIKERFVSEKSGKLLISIYPKSNIWEEKTLRKFFEQTRLVDENITGMPILMLIFIDLIKEKGALSVFLGTIVIILLLLLDFRSVKYTVMALIPLGVGAVWMLGLMYLFGMKLNMNNFMALPIIIGIGIDDGVHILHRYVIEGKHSISKVTKFTGKAILLTSLTTMISFGSIGMASHRGLASMGIVLVLGVGSCFVCSAFLLPALISLRDMFRDNSKERRK
jgi:uncharacterized protein